MTFRLYMVTIPVSIGIAAGGLTLVKMSQEPHFLGGEPYSIPTRHPVTDQMLKAAASLKRTPAPDFMLTDQESHQIGTGDLRRGIPSVLFFIKDGCPCSIEAQPVFNSLAQAYGGDAQFFGVIDAETTAATSYVQANVVPFRVICDPHKGMVKGFKIVASASMALVDGDGQIVRVWPGYSQDTMRQLNLLLGTLAKTGPKEFNDSEAPKTPTAGCAYF